MSDQTIFDRLKPHTGALNFVGTIVIGGVIAFGNIRAGSAHASDVLLQQQQEIAKQGEQIKGLQEQLNKQSLVLAAVGEFKQDTATRLDRIESKIDRELQFHRTGQ